SPMFPASLLGHGELYQQEGVRQLRRRVGVLRRGRLDSDQGLGDRLDRRADAPRSWPPAELSPPFAQRVVWQLTGMPRGVVTNKINQRIPLPDCEQCILVRSHRFELQIYTFLFSNNN